MVLQLQKQIAEEISLQHPVQYAIENMEIQVAMRIVFWKEKTIVGCAQKKVDFFAIYHIIIYNILFYKNI